ncbi:hypothetical protein [Pollutibacter soli]|uniref:tetratricopeptide repeat protein n=1 Tax=Pollutibacter soli TaxID=3034157 RepID=UPI003013B85B
MTKNELVTSRVTEALNQILGSEIFQNSKALSQFLKFVVEETLAGRGRELKEYIIGLKVLFKKADFNPQTDPVVRIHAGRLRRALNEYYSNQGKNDQIVITIPKGTYVPEFSEKAPSEKNIPASSQPESLFSNRTTVAVFPFRNISTDPAAAFFQDGLADQLSSELAGYSELSVVSYYSSRSISERTTDIKEAGRLLDAKYMLTGTVQGNAETIRVRVQLILSETREQLWAESFEKKSTITDLFEIQDDIVRHVVSRIAGHFGAIVRNTSKIPPAKNIEDLKIYDAIFWYYHFVNDVSEEIFRKSLAAMQHSVRIAPEYALGWAVLGEIHIGGYFMGYRIEGTPDMIEEAYRCGKRSIKIDPFCQHAYQTLALASLFKKNRAETLKTINDWKKIPHQSAGIMGGIGFCLICCGEYDEGMKLIDDSVHLNPYYQWWINGGAAFYFFKKEQYDDAIYWAEKMNMPNVPWELIIKTTALAEMNLPAEASYTKEKLFNRFPELERYLEPYINAFIQDTDLTRKIYRQLVEVGAH